MIPVGFYILYIFAMKTNLLGHWDEFIIQIFTFLKY